MAAAGVDLGAQEKVVEDVETPVAEEVNEEKADA